MAKREFNIPVLRDKGGMTPEVFQTAVSEAIADAVSYIDEDIAPFREAATAYYRGDPLGNEEDGRSKIVMTEVRDVVQAILPSLLRVFCSTERACEFIPTSEAKIEEAEQATDYVNYVVMSDNNGFKLFFDVFKDALIRKTGIFKWFVEDVECVDEQTYTGMSEEQLRILSQEDDIELISVDEEEDASDPVVDPEALPPTPTFEARIRRYREERRFRVVAVPPEELIIARDAKNEDDTPYIGHRRELPVSDLVSMGYDLDEILANMGTSTGFELNNEATARNPALSTGVGEGIDPQMRKVLYTESYVMIDKDGDGIAERRRVCTLGGHHYVLHEELWGDMNPFAMLCPDPEPHMAIGYSMADQVVDLQEIKTSIVRNTLDSLAQTIHPRTVVVETQVNMDDVLNPEVGGIIRARAPGMVQPLAEPFVGQSAMPIIDYFDQIKASRTGISAATQGLDPDVLQSTTKAAVTAVTQASTQRIEMIARIFAETGVKRLMRGVLNMLIRNQDKERLIRLRGKFVPVDPRYWDSAMSVSINVGLGMGNAQERLMMLGQIAAKQEQIIQQTGPLNPLCTIMELRNTYAAMVETANMRDVSRYFKPVTAEHITAYIEQQQKAKGQAQMDPNLLLVQVEAEKVRADIANNDKKMQLELVKARMEDDRKRDEAERNFYLKMAEINARFGAQVDVASVNAGVTRERDMDSATLQALQGMQPPPPPVEGAPQ